MPKFHHFQVDKIKTCKLRQEAKIDFGGKMNESFVRTGVIFGDMAMKKFNDSKVAIIGLGGVGSFAAEGLVRSGIGKILIADFDTISKSNINRQLVALESTIGQYKAEVMKKRLLDINPKVEIEVIIDFIDGSNVEKILKSVDFVVDAIDSLNPKANLLEYLFYHQIKMISVMGAGGRTNPSYIKEADLFETNYCPLARRLRKYLRHRGIKSGIPTIFTNQEPIPQLIQTNEEDIISRGRKRGIIGSVSYMPAIMGMWASSFVLRKIANTKP